MDILKEIEKQINSIKKNDNSNFLDSIYTHIDRAENYYIRGKIESDFYNDVIYRSNQAFEGALKESYKILAEKTDEQVFKKTPNEIEKYLEKENIFRERVLELFKNYRQEWRNKSTHDFKLLFDESEAFIALTSVSSFVHLLLKQIQEKIALNVQQKKLKDEKGITEEIIKITTSSKSPTKKLTELILEFYSQNSSYIYNNPEIKEYEIIGLFHAYLNVANKDIETLREPSYFVNNITIRPDFLLKIDNQEIILEFKRFKAIGSIINNNINQLLIYMQATDTFESVIYNAKFIEEFPEPKIEHKKYYINEKKYLITIITT